MEKKVYILVQVTVAQKQIIEAVAKKAGMSKSGLLRFLALERARELSREV